MKYPPVRFDDAHRDAIAAGFGIACEDAGYRCLACHIGYDHTHLVLENHPRDINVIAGHLKAAATRVLTARHIHPLKNYLGKRGGFPTPWSEGSWKVFIDTPEQLTAAIAYVQRHAAKEGLPEQHWDFVTTYR